MFKDFDTTKKQLAELADTLNKFESEAVQLRLLELLFDAKPHEIDAAESETPAPKVRKARRRRASTKKAREQGQQATPKKKTALGTGAVAILGKLHDEGYFSKPRTINEICAHADTSLARKIKPSDLSGKLARMVRGGDLSRKKNSDNQYEYTNP